MRRATILGTATVVCLSAGLGVQGQTRTTASGYFGEIIGENVLVRSGPSTNHYPVARLQSGMRVHVVGGRDGWLTIDPPAGCFSLIHKNFVDIDPDATSGEGVVNGDSVLVRAGSELSQQLSSKQLKLNRGATVRVLKAHNADYLRIVPPTGAHVYVSDKFVRRLSGQSAVAPPVGTKEAVAAKTPVAAPSAREPVARPVVGKQGANDSAEASTIESPVSHRQALADADALLATEEAKPLLHRDYGPVISRFEAIAAGEGDAYATAYARARLVQLHDAAETLAVVKELRASGDELTASRKAAVQTRDRIRPPLPKIGGGFDVVGELRRSMIYGSKAYPHRYRLVADDGLRTVGYVEIPDTLSIDISRFLGRKVGVRAAGTRLQAEDVDPVMIYIVSEIVLLDVGNTGKNTLGTSVTSQKPTEG